MQLPYQVLMNHDLQSAAQAGEIATVYPCP